MIGHLSWVSQESPKLYWNIVWVTHEYYISKMISVIFTWFLHDPFNEIVQTCNTFSSFVTFFINTIYKIWIISDILAACCWTCFSFKNISFLSLYTNRDIIYFSHVLILLGVKTESLNISEAKWCFTFMYISLEPLI